MSDVRVLITGSRTWDNADLIGSKLDALHKQHGDALVVVHGACPKGADFIADNWCKIRGVRVERFPADWNTHGKSAGHRRNQQMVDTRPGLCLAFIRDASPGATGCAAAAQLAGIPVTRHEYAALTTDTAPPSTITELRQVLIDFEAARPRSMQKELGPSELGTPCQQQIARKLAGAPRRPITEPTWAPFQGTAVHASMEDVVAYWNASLGRERWLAEDRLVVDPGPGHYPAIEGNGDAFDLDHGMVVDWKHVGTTSLTKLRTAKRLGKPPREQVSQDYRIQAHLYGLGHANKGRDVKHVRLVLLSRSWKYDDSDEWTEPYNPDLAQWAIERYWGVVDLVDELDVTNRPHAIAAVPANPGNCGFCPFKRGGQPSDWDGCAGDEAAHERRIDRLTDGLIAAT